MMSIVRKLLPWAVPMVLGGVTVPVLVPPQEIVMLAGKVLEQAGAEVAQPLLKFVSERE